MANWSLAAQVDPGPASRSPMASIAEWTQIRTQQEAARGLAAQRQAIDAERQQKMEQAQLDVQRADALRNLKTWTPETVFPIVGPKDGAEILKGIGALQEQNLKTEDGKRVMLGSVIGGLLKLPESMRAESYDAVVQHLAQRGILDPTQVEPYSPDTLLKYQAQAMTADQQATTDLSARGQAETARHNAALEAPKPADVGSLGDYMDSFAQGLGLKSGKQLNPRQKLTAKAQFEAAGRAPERDTEPLQAIMGPDGRPVLVRRSDALGKTPASIREQGRQVTSGDAGILAEFDSALDDIGAVRSVLQSPGKTGAAPSAESYVPNFVTSMTGLGTEAKQTQATIDRVKQVIGKTLEGGVLRKEDEAKYEKILPTISDPAPIVKTKLDGLEKAIQRRKQRQIDALENAGYDTSKFGRPGAAAPSAPASADTPKAPSKIGRFTVEVH